MIPDELAKTVRDHIQKQAVVIIEDEAQNAAKRAVDRVRNLTAEVVARVADRYTLSRHGEVLRIEVNIESSKL